MLRISAIQQNVVTLMNYGIIRLEVRLEESYKFLQKQIDDLKTLVLWGFGILFGGMGLLIGFVIWDRRTAVAPVAKG